MYSFVNEGYDQSDKNYTIYIDLKGVGALDKGQIEVEFKKSSLSLVVSNLNGKTHELIVSKLGGEVDPEKCKYKVKPDKITVTLKKVNGEDWKGLSEKEANVKLAKEKESKSVPEIDKDKDPSESLMDMMKKMYDEGDDDMKRTIAKAWTESREKQAAGNMGL